MPPSCHKSPADPNQNADQNDVDYINLEYTVCNKCSNHDQYGARIFIFDDAGYHVPGNRGNDGTDTCLHTFQHLTDNKIIPESIIKNEITEMITNGGITVARIVMPIPRMPANR